MAAPAGLTPIDRPPPPWRRLLAADRLGGIDLARGLAVIGMVAAHLLVIPPLRWDEPGTWADVVNGRSSILFAVLAGISIALTTGGRVPVAGEAAGAARRRLAVRAGLLWMLGIALTLTGVPVYVILPAYAILFLVAALVVTWSARALLVAGAAGALLAPWLQAWLGLLPWWESPGGEAVALLIGWAYPFPLWWMFVVVGMGVGRLPIRRTRTQALLLGVGALTAVVGYGAAALLGRGTDPGPGDGPGPGDYLDVVTSAAAHSGGVPEVVGSTGVAIAVVAACMLACRGIPGLILLPLRATGSMPLTAYTAQIVAWAVWSFAVLGDTGDLAGFRALEPFLPMTAGLVVACTAWALGVGRGPVETLMNRALQAAVPVSGASARGG